MLEMPLMRMVYIIFEMPRHWRQLTCVFAAGRRNSAKKQTSLLPRWARKHRSYHCVAKGTLTLESFCCGETRDTGKMEECKFLHPRWML